MDDLVLIAIVFTVLTVIGVPLFAAVGVTTILALYLIDIPYTLMAQTGYNSLTPFPLLTIPAVHPGRPADGGRRHGDTG